MSVAVQLPPTTTTSKFDIMATTSSSTQQSASSASASTSAEAMSLPPMPVPYEDFHFSLDLPAELDINDLQFLSSVDRKGGSSRPMTPGLTSHFMATTPQLSSFGLDDIQMASRPIAAEAACPKAADQHRPKWDPLASQNVH